MGIGEIGSSFVDSIKTFVGNIKDIVKNRENVINSDFFKRLTRACIKSLTTKTNENSRTVQKFNESTNTTGPTAKGNGEVQGKPKESNFESTHITNPTVGNDSEIQTKPEELSYSGFSSDEFFKDREKGKQNSTTEVSSNKVSKAPTESKEMTIEEIIQSFPLTPPEKPTSFSFPSAIRKLSEKGKPEKEAEEQEIKQKAEKLANNFVNAALNQEDLLGILTSCFGENGTKPLKDLSEAQKKALQKALENIRIVNYDPKQNNQLYLQQWENKAHLQGLKYALDVALGSETKDKISQEIINHTDSSLFLLSIKGHLPTVKATYNALVPADQRIE